MKVDNEKLSHLRCEVHPLSLHGTLVHIQMSLSV